MNKTIKAIQVNGKYIVFTADADLSVYPPEAIKTYSFEFESPDTGDLINVGDLIQDYSLRRDTVTGAYSDLAYRLAYNCSFTRAVCSSVTYPGADGALVTEGRDPAKSKLTLDKKAVEKIPADVLFAFVSASDPTAVNADDMAALKAMRVEPATPTPA